MFYIYVAPTCVFAPSAKSPNSLRLSPPLSLSLPSCFSLSLYVYLSHFSDILKALLRVILIDETKEAKYTFPITRAIESADSYLEIDFLRFDVDPRRIQAFANLED